MPGNQESNNEFQNYRLVELRFMVPDFVAQWLDKKAREIYKTRNHYIKDWLIAAWRKENGR